MGSVGAARELEGAIARAQRRFGTHAVVRGAAVERRAEERRLRTGTVFDRLTGGGLATAAACAFIGQGACGKVALALRGVAAAQRQGSYAMWIDVTASLDPLAASQAGVDLGRLLVVRARTRERAVLAGAAGLRSDGFRIVVLDVGPDLADPPIRADDIAPLLPVVRGSTAALVAISDHGPRRVAVPTFHFERIAWERQLDRTSGWTFAVRGGRGELALFHAQELGRTLHDLGLRAELVEATA